jgi:uncharacterized protein (DUF2267 family)
LTGELPEALVQQMLEAILDKNAEDNQPQCFWKCAVTVQALAGKLTNLQAQQALDAVLQAMRVTRRFPILPYEAQAEAQALAQAAQALIEKLTNVQAGHVIATGMLQSALGWSATSDEAADWARAIAVLLVRTGEPEYVGAIVELLKYPMAAGRATDVLLHTVHDAIPTAPGVAAGLPANLRWIARTYPQINLTSAPGCPTPLQKGLVCPAEAAPLIASRSWFGIFSSR